MARIEYEDEDTYICVELLEDAEDGLILHNRSDLDMKFRELLTGLGFRYPQEAYDVDCAEYSSVKEIPNYYLNEDGKLILRTEVEQ